MLKHPLAREVAIIFAIKAALIIAAGVFLFGPAQRPAIDAEIAQQHLIDDPAVTANRSPRP
jgi:uncharacterized protein HemX